MNAFNSLVRMPGTALQSETRERAFDLRELRYFYSVARTGNFGRAARELNISQPAISHQIRKLEEGLGTQLLVRHGRGVMLTPAGGRLRDRIDAIIQLLSTPLTEGAAAAAATGSISLAVSAEIAPLLIAPLAKQFRARWPGVALHVREGTGADIEQSILNHRVDMAVTHDPPNLPELDVTPVLSESLGLVVPVHSAAAQDGRPVRLREIAGEALILPGSEHWICRRVETAAQRYGLRLDRRLQVNSVASTKAMVRNGLGSTILPLISVQDEVSRGVLAYRPVSHPELLSHCAIVCRRAAPPIVADFVEIARGTMTALAEQGVWTGAHVVRTNRTGDAGESLAPIEHSGSEPRRIAA